MSSGNLNLMDAQGENLSLMSDLYMSRFLSGIHALDALEIWSLLYTGKNNSVCVIFYTLWFEKRLLPYDSFAFCIECTLQYLFSNKVWCKEFKRALLGCAFYVTD